MCTKRVTAADKYYDSKIPPAKDNIRNKESTEKSSLPKGCANDPNTDTRISNDRRQ